MRVSFTALAQTNAVALYTRWVCPLSRRPRRDAGKPDQRVKVFDVTTFLNIYRVFSSTLLVLSSSRRPRNETDREHRGSCQSAGFAKQTNNPQTTLILANSLRATCKVIRCFTRNDPLTRNRLARYGMRFPSAFPDTRTPEQDSGQNGKLELAQ